MSAAGERIFLTGLSGSGKSTVGPLLAKRLGWEFIDTDVLIQTHTGRTIPTIFREEGEAAFRDYEVSVMEEVAKLSRVVVSTGGGVPTSDRGRAALRSGFVIWLQVSPETAAVRLASQKTDEERPMLEGDPSARLRELLESRQGVYSQADACLDVDSLSADEAAKKTAELWMERSKGSLKAAARVETAGAICPIFVDAGAIAHVGSVCQQVGLSGGAFVVTDDAIPSAYRAAVSDSLTVAGYATAAFAIPSGEEHKTLATVGAVYDWLLENRVERTDFVVCLGGGVVTDLGGFAAATCLRGLRFVHVPTTLLAMSDAAVGGKTGVDHRLGKNMIGAFVQPAAVVMDTDVLQTLPERQIRAGMAEVIKHGFILDEGLVRELEAAGDTLERLVTPELVARSVGIKAAVVSADEREAGNRALLNYGHTIGHAIETVTGYERFQHGEAVAIGMHAAALIARALGRMSDDDFHRQQKLIRSAGLPEFAPGLDAQAIIKATSSDKKVRGGRSRWILLDGIGHAEVVDDVPEDVVRAAVETIVA